jgi:hypothetical protein
MVRKGSSVRVRQRAWGHLQGKSAGAAVRSPRLAQRGRNVRPRLVSLRVVVRWAGPPWTRFARRRAGTSESIAWKSWPTPHRVPGGSVAERRGITPSDGLPHARARDSSSTAPSQPLAVLKTAAGACLLSSISRGSSVRPAHAGKSARTSRRFAGGSRLRANRLVGWDRRCWRPARSPRPSLSCIDVARWPRRSGAVRPRAPREIAS